MSWRDHLNALERELLEHEELQLHVVLNNLVTAQDIADMLGYTSTNTINTYKNRESSGFPEPVKRFGRIDVWWLPDVMEWAAKNSRTPPLRDLG